MPTHCPYCALQCGQWVDADGAVDAREFPTNCGGLCQKGWTAGRLLDHPQWLTTPLLRRTRSVAQASTDWDTALHHVADRLTALRAAHGPDAVAVFGAGGLTNEKGYLLGRFARVALGTSQIDYNGRFCMSTAAAAANRAFGTDRGLPFPVTDLDDAEVILLAGANPAETMPPLMGHFTQAALIVVDPRRTPTAQRALDSGGLHLQPLPGTDLVLALGILHAAVVDGHHDRPYLDDRTTGAADVWRIATQGGREHGQKADQLPGYRSITDPAARAHVARVWGIEPDDLPGPGRSATELLDAIGRPDGPRALLVFGSNLLVSAPDAATVARRLAALDLLVVADVLPGETAAAADVLFPVAQWAEEEGTMTNLEGRVLRRRRAMAPPPGVRTDLQVISGLAAALGVDGFPEDPEAVFTELRAASAGGPADYAGISYARLDAGEALHWPCPDETHPGTPRLFLDRFAHADGRARMIAVEPAAPAEAPDAEFPLRATTGRVLVHYQSGAQTRRVRELADVEPRAFVEVHPDTAARAGLGDGDPARVVSRRGTTSAQVRYGSTLHPDTVFLPFHFGGAGSANRITLPALDPISRMSEFKLAAVRLEAIEVEEERS